MASTLQLKIVYMQQCIYYYRMMVVILFLKRSGLLKVRKKLICPHSTSSVFNMEELMPFSVLSRFASAGSFNVAIQTLL